MKKAVFIAGFLFCCAFSFAQNEPDKEQLVREFYSLYDSYVNAIAQDNVESAESISNAVHARFLSLNDSERSYVEKRIAEEALSSFEKDGNLVFLGNAERALFILPPSSSHSFDLLGIMGDVYAGQSNREGLLSTIERMSRLPMASEDDCMVVINELKEKASNIKPIEQSINGYWISSLYSTVQDQEFQPFLILDIQDVQGKTVAAISSQSAIIKQAMISKRSDLWKSIDSQFDNTRGSFLFDFYKGSSHQGNPWVSEGLINTAQGLEARMNAYADRPDVKFDDAIKGMVAGDVAALGLLALGLYVAQSRVKEDQLYIWGTKTGEDAFSSRIVFQEQIARNSAQGHSNNMLVDTDMTLFRWKEEDGIVFGDGKARPISPYVSRLNRNMELYDVKRSTSLSQPRYMLPMIVGALVGAGVLGLGVKKLSIIPSLGDLEQEYGRSVSVKEYDAISKENGWDKQLVSGVIICSGGFTIGIVSMVIQINLSGNRRAKAVADYNERQFNKLYELHR